MWVFPLTAAVVALAFAAALGRRFARSRRLYLALWCAALLMYGVASLAVAAGAAGGWSRRPPSGARSTRRRP
jgi:apolipoprotein N-acyltransferase